MLIRANNTTGKCDTNGPCDTQKKRGPAWKEDPPEGRMKQGRGAEKIRSNYDVASYPNNNLSSWPHAAQVLLPSSTSCAENHPRYPPSSYSLAVSENKSVLTTKWNESKIQKQRLSPIITTFSRNTDRIRSKESDLARESKSSLEKPDDIRVDASCITAKLSNSVFNIKARIKKALKTGSGHLKAECCPWGSMACSNSRDFSAAGPRSCSNDSELKEGYANSAKMSTHSTRVGFGAKLGRTWKMGRFSAMVRRAILIKTGNPAQIIFNVLIMPMWFCFDLLIFTRLMPIAIHDSIETKTTQTAWFSTTGDIWSGEGTCIAIVASDSARFRSDFIATWNSHSGLVAVVSKPNLCDEIFTNERDFLSYYERNRRNVSAAIVIQSPLSYSIRVNEDLVDMPEVGNNFWGNP
ncbi:unnamed protein product, partial [Notodromas monacha]